MSTRSVGGCVDGNDGDWRWSQKGKDDNWLVVVAKRKAF
jgi:hypothetical protein